MTEMEGDRSKSVALPDEILEQIFCSVTPKDLSSLSQVSRRFCQISKSSAAWEDAYLIFWRDGDDRKAEKRGVRRWREVTRADALRSTASRAWKASQLNGSSSQEPQRKAMKMAGEKAEETSLFRIHPTFCASSDWNESGLRLPRLPDFYSLFRERLAIDQMVIEAIEEQCFKGTGWVRRLDDMVTTYGNDMKDVLHAIVSVQERKNCEFDVYERDLLSRNVGEQGELRDFPSAFSLRLPTATRSRSHHLTILHLARDILQHLQAREAMKGLMTLRSAFNTRPSMANSWSSLTPLDGGPGGSQTAKNLAHLGKQFENGLCWLTMFCGGEGQEVSEELDVLACACALFLAKHYPTSRTDALQCAVGISSFMNSRGFRGASDVNFRNLDNNFIHLCLDESGRDSLPLTLVVIFCSIATRLGLHALPTNTPMKLMAVVDGFIVDRSQQPCERFWVNVHGDGQILQRGDMLNLFPHRGILHESAIMSPSTPAECSVRAARNIIASVQRAQAVPAFHTDPAGELGEELGRGATYAQANVLSADERFERMMRSPDNVFNPRRTFRHPKSKQIHLHSPFWDEDERRRHTPLSLGYNKSKGDLLTSLGRYRRSHRWTEAAQHAAMHAASSALIRIDNGLGERGLLWSMSLVQTHFPLDILVLRDEIVQGETEGEHEQGNSPFGQGSERVRSSILAKYDVMMGEEGEVEPKRRVWEETRDDGSTVHRTIATAPSGDSVFMVGTVFVHRSYFYRAVVIGWDTFCNTNEDWILNMGVDSLPNGGRQQPFYHSLVEDGSTRYVAHCNIQHARLAAESEVPMLAVARSIRARIDPSVILPDELERVMEVRGVGEYFRCASFTNEETRELRLLCNAYGQREFPDDVTERT